MSSIIHIGFLLFHSVNQLDLTGPAQVLSRVPNAKVHLVWKDRQPVVTDVGFAILPTATFEECPHLNVLCVLGGFGSADQLTNPETHRIYGGSVTAGIHFALAGVDLAKTLQLALEYGPAPPFDCGSSEKTGPELVGRLRAMQAFRLEHAEAQIERAALVEAS
jgi:hypothetical protein